MYQLLIDSEHCQRTDIKMVFRNIVYILSDNGPILLNSEIVLTLWHFSVRLALINSVIALFTYKTKNKTIETSKIMTNSTQLQVSLGQVLKLCHFVSEV